MKALLAGLLMVAGLLAHAGAQAQAAPRPGAGVMGTVTSVVDGDSVWVTPSNGGKAIEVRLAGIDAPEICQEGGIEAKAYLVELVLKQPVRLVIGNGQGGGDHDLHGRTLGHLWKDEVDVNRRLVEEGHAWSIRTKYDRGPYVPQERMAKALSRGVHKLGSAALMPKDFRQRHGPCNKSSSAAPEVVPSTAGVVPAAARTRTAAAPAAAYRCDGRTHCSQMTSCAEATYFLNNCPGIKMDGNHDGVPCEKQWCRR